MKDASLRDNSNFVKGFKRWTSYSNPCNDAEEHLNCVPKIVPKRKRYFKYKSVSPTTDIQEELADTCVGGMSASTPAAHTGSVVQSRPLSPVVLPYLQRQLLESMTLISDIFPTSSELTKLSKLPFGSAIPLVYRPRLLLLGGEGVGLNHLGPAILHKLQNFPIHSLGLPSLFLDPGAKTPEEALGRIFSEARRTIASILYIPMFNNWWESAHEQLRDLFLTLLEELSDIKEQSVFGKRSVYTVDKPSRKDRSLFFDHLIEAALSVISGLNEKSDGPPKVPKAPTGLKPAEIIAKVKAEQNALRRLRMCLRNVCNR